MSDPLEEQQLPTYVGPLEPFEFTISEQVQAEYLESLEDYHLRYVLSRHGAPPVVHPGVLLSHSNATRSPSLRGPNTRWLHMREQTHFCAPARIGDGLVARWRIEEHEPWFWRVLTRVSCMVTRCDGTVILERTMWGFRSTAERPVPPAPARSPGPPAPPPHRACLDPDGWQIPGRPKQPTGERIRLFSGRTHNLHTDDQVARDAGLPAPVASAAQGMGYLCEFMVDNLGEEWLAGGSWVLMFCKPVFPGDLITASGTLSSAGPDRCTMDLRLVNQRGVTVTQGTATALA
jgi:acyl dehydratase